MLLYAMLAGSIVAAGVVMTILTMLYRSPASESRQLREERTVLPVQPIFERGGPSTRSCRSA